MLRVAKAGKAEAAGSDATIKARERIGCFILIVCIVVFRKYARPFCENVDHLIVHESKQKDKSFRDAPQMFASNEWVLIASGGSHKYSTRISIGTPDS